jgi:transcriptional regulator with XRE-family HTH domain
MADLKRHNGTAIRCMRIKIAKLKPGEFARVAGIAYSTLDNIENERKEASLEALHRIADALGVPPEAIVRDPACLVPSATSQTVPQPVPA